MLDAEQRQGAASLDSPARAAEEVDRLRLTWRD
jgi:hypothetical protein